MRKDHHKLICEKERHNSHAKYHNIRHAKFNASNDDPFDFEEGDDQIQGSSRSESMKRHHKWNWWSEKSFNDFTSPIYGYIRKNVGRIWDNVYSEFCAEYDQRSVLTKHLFSHLRGQICTRVVARNDELWIYNRYRGIEPLSKSYYEFYVDPRDGILKLNNDYKYYKTKERERRKQLEIERSKTRRIVDKFTEHHLINGVWFEVKFVERDGQQKHLVCQLGKTNNPRYYTYSRIEYRYMYDVLLKTASDQKRVAVSKRTLSKKELRDYELTTCEAA